MVLDGRTCFLLYLTDITEKYTHNILILAEGIEQNVGILANFYEMGRVDR
jgi:hypothetical protein